MLFGAIVAAGPGPDPGPIDYIGTAVIGLILTIGFLRGTRARIELTNGGLTVFNYFSTHYIPWHELRDASVDYGGMRLTTTDGSVIAVGSLGKSNWSTWCGRTTAADDRVDVIRAEIMRRAGSA